MSRSGYTDDQPTEGIEHGPMPAAPAPAARGEDSTLQQIRSALIAANEQRGGPIRDTIWMPTGCQTLFDFIDSALSDAATAPVAPGDTRGDFEAWITGDSTLPITRELHGYTDMTTALMWHAWQAAQKASAPGGALVGESDAKAGLGLADADDTCAHAFSVQPSSGMKLCVHCGLSEGAARKLAQTERELVTNRKESKP